MDITTNIEENYKYILGRLYHHYFPDSKNDELLEQMNQGKDRILLEFHSAEYAGNIRAIVHIEKSESGTYFPNRYQLELHKPESKYTRRQFFQIQNFKGHEKKYDVSWKMGMNLLRGAQVLNNWLLEDGSSIKEWRGLDFSKKTIAGYGHVSFEPQEFDLTGKLNELPIQEKNKDDLRHSAVIRSLEMGNTQTVHLDGPETFNISLRANIPKRELDIIYNGNILSPEEFISELSEWRNQGVYIGGGPSDKEDAGEKQAGDQMLASKGKVLIPDGQGEKRDRMPSQDQPAMQNSGEIPSAINNVSIKSGTGGLQQKESWLEPSNLEKMKKVLTGNQISPYPSNHQANSKKNGM
jgi:hypothetical protein